MASRAFAARNAPNAAGASKYTSMAKTICSVFLPPHPIIAAEAPITVK